MVQHHTITLTPPLIARFWEKVEKNGPIPAHCPELGPCWVWMAARIKLGSYGLLSKLLAHRLSWVIHYGSIPDGLFVCHHCDNPPCVNPAHLFLGTRSDNMLDAFNKGRLPDHRGTSHGQAKLTEAQVRTIRATDGVPYTTLATMFSVHHSTIHYIKSRKTWRHLL